MLASIIVAVGMFILTSILTFFFANDLKAKEGFTLFTVGGWIKSILFGLLVGAAYYCAPLSVTVAGIALAVIIGLMFYMTCWALARLTRWYELLTSVGIFAILAFVGYRAASYIRVASSGWSTLFNVLPFIVLALGGCIVLVDFFLCHYRGLHKKQDEVLGRGPKILYLIAAIVAILVAVVVIVLLLLKVDWSGFGKNRIKTSTTSQETTAAETISSESASWYEFYNRKNLEDEDPLNDYNFGPDPYYEVWTDVASDYDANFRERLKRDPALAAAAMAWLDANVGTRYLGEFYESCKGDWEKTMNLTKERFMADQQLYYQTLDAFFAFLDTADKVEIRECKSVSDQMYMNPYTVDGVPDIIVVLTDDHSGYELVYTFIIKDNVFEVAYRINCGYQPTDVAEIMHITPEEPSTEPERPTEPPTTEPPTTEPPTTEPPTTYNKDPEKATYEYLEPNDDTGHGPDTNAGKDATESPKDQPENSNHYDSYDDYKEDIQELESINETQKQGGGDSNTPSTKPSTDTNDDNSGDTGNGGAPIDDYVSPGPAVHGQNGDQIYNTGDNEVGEWGNGDDFQPN